MADFKGSTNIAHVHGNKPGPAQGQKGEEDHADLKGAFVDLKDEAFTCPPAAADDDASAVENPLQVVFSFDTTISMQEVLNEVRARLSEMLQRLLTDLPGVTIAVVAHGDYYSAEEFYLTKHIDFTNDSQRLVEFVNGVEMTYGGDFPEAYEVMLRVVRKDLSWSPGSRRILVVIGDSWPHDPYYFLRKDKIDWIEETRTLKKQMGVRIYGIQVDTHYDSTEFFRKLTKMTEGQHLNLLEVEPICDVTTAICYREKGLKYLQDFEEEVRARRGNKSLPNDLADIFKALKRHALSFPITGPATEKFEADVRARNGNEALHTDLENVFKQLERHAVSVPIIAPAPQVTNVDSVDSPTSRVPKRTSPKESSSALFLSLFFCVFVLVCMIIRFLTGTDCFSVLMISLPLTLFLVLSL